MFNPCASLDHRIAERSEMRNTNFTRQHVRMPDFQPRNSRTSSKTARTRHVHLLQPVMTEHYRLTCLAESHLLVDIW